MPIVSSTLGSPTKTCWKRRSRAGSFSMCSRYSSSVVAPTMRSSPRASIGLIMLPASMAESPLAPAPTIVCSSSMKVMISPSASVISDRTALSRSSNSPRYLAPATIEARSSAMSRLPLRLSGTSPATIRWARPSTIAVLPTPGSPMSTGLFLVRRDSTWTTRRISVSRPMTGSILPSRARWVRSTAYFSRAWKVPSGSGVVTLRLPRTVRKAASSASAVAPAPLSTAPAAPPPPPAPGPREPHQQVLGGDELVAEGAGLLARGVEHAQQLARGRGGGHGGAADARQAARGGGGLGADVGRVGADRLEQRAGDAVGLFQEGDQQMQGFQGGLATADRQALGRRDRFLRTGGELALHGPVRVLSSELRGRPAPLRKAGAASLAGSTTPELSLFHSTPRRPVAAPQVLAPSDDRGDAAVEDTESHTLRGMTALPAPSVALDDQLCFALYAASRAVTARYRPMLDELGLTYPQYLVMMLLWEEDHQTVGQLGTKLALDSGTLSPLLKRLTAAGLVTRHRRVEDERSVSVRLTDAGRALEGPACAISAQMIDALALDKSQFTELKGQLRTITDRVSETRADVAAR